MKTFKLLKVAWHCHQSQATKKYLVAKYFGNKKPLLCVVARVFVLMHRALFEAIVQATNPINDDADIAARFHGTNAN